LGSLASPVKGGLKKKLSTPSHCHDVCPGFCANKHFDYYVCFRDGLCVCVEIWNIGSVMSH